MDFSEIFSSVRAQVAQIVNFDKSVDKIYPLDLSISNPNLTEKIISDTTLFSEWINKQLSENNCRYAVGGYNENRVIYNSNDHFNSTEEPRSLHLGIDIWAPVGTEVYAPLNGKIHSFKFNKAIGDYGAAIIFEHNLSSFTFYTLYGHLSLASIQNLIKGKPIKAGEKLAELGNFIENGNWPPHLHFQIILDIQNHTGDYPGVCSLSKQDYYLNNCPNPEIILKSTF